MNLTNSEYIQTLISNEKQVENDEALLPTTVISMAKLKTMSLSDKIQVLLRDGKLHFTPNLILLLKHKKKNPQQKY